MLENESNNQAISTSSRASRYIEFVKWLFVDSIFRNRGTCLLIVSSGILATVLEINALALVIYYGGLLSKGDTFEYLNYSYVVRDSFVPLIFVAICTFVLLIGSALLTWYSRLTTLRLRKKYELFCSRRVLQLISGGELFFPDSNSKFHSDGVVIRVARMDSRYCGRIMVALLTSLSPLVIALIACVGLFIIDSFLSSIIVVLLGISAFVMGKIGVAGANASVEIERNQKLTSRAFKRIIQYIKSSSTDRTLEDGWLDEQLYTTKPVKSYYRFYENRLRVTEHSQLTSNILLAVGILVITIVLGYQAIASSTGWETLVIYLLALRYALVNVKRIFTKITNINRFYPQLRRYLDFINSSKHAEELDQPFPEAVLQSTCIQNSKAYWNPESKLVHAILWDKPINSINIQLLYRLIFSDERIAHSFAKSTYTLSQETELLAKDPVTPECFGINRSYEQEEDLNKLKQAEAICASREQNRVCYSLFAARQSKKKILAIDSMAVDDIKQILNLRSLIAPSFPILIVYKGLFFDMSREWVSDVVVATSSSVCGVGDVDWLNRNAEELKTHFRLASEARSTNGIDEDDDDDDE